MGKSRPAVANALRLLSLSPEVLRLVESGELSAGHARALVPLQDPDVQLLAAKEILSKALSVRKAELLAAKVQNKKMTSETEPADSEQVDYAKEVSALLTKKFGRKVRLVEGRKIGKIEMEFYNPDDREVLLSQLNSLKF